MTGNRGDRDRRAANTGCPDGREPTPGPARSPAGPARSPDRCRRFGGGSDADPCRFPEIMPDTASASDSESDHPSRMTRLGPT